MSDKSPLPPVAALKDQARRLRTALAEAKTAISHAQALELVASQHGFRDWNTLSAAIKTQPGNPVRLGQRVEGRYLGQPFTGEITALHATDSPDRNRVTVQFDEAVDVVRFASFSSLRRRVKCTLNGTGRTAEATSDGTPHLVLTG